MGAGVKSARHWVWKRTGSVLMINFIYTNFLTGSAAVEFRTMWLKMKNGGISW